MDTSRFNVYAIPFLRGKAVEQFSYSALLAFFIEFYRCYILVESYIEFCPGFGIHNVPQFGLAVRVFPLKCKFISRMHLYRYFLLYIKNLYKEREIPFVVVENIFTYKVTKVDLHKFIQSVSCKEPVLYSRTSAIQAPQFPTFTYSLANGILVKVLVEDFCKVISAPDSLSCVGNEFYRI